MKKSCIVNIEIGRFTNNPRFQQKNFSNIKFDKALHSINNKDEKFTNFIDNTGNLKFKELKRLYDSKNPFDILESDFSPQELLNENEKDNNTVLRLFRLINETNGIFLFLYNYKDVVKYKNKNYEEYQLYFQIKNNNLILRLVDMHHLAIPALNRRTMKIDYKDFYNNVCRKYKTCISLIKQ